jgi:hypothetical protein
MFRWRCPQVDQNLKKVGHAHGPPVAPWYVHFSGWKARGHDGCRPPGLTPPNRCYRTVTGKFLMLGFRVLRGGFLKTNGRLWRKLSNVLPAADNQLLTNLMTPRISKTRDGWEKFASAAIDTSFPHVCSCIKTFDLRVINT